MLDPIKDDGKSAEDSMRSEDSAEYQDLLEQLRRHYEPADIAEDLEVQRRCASLWRWTIVKMEMLWIAD